MNRRAVIAGLLFALVPVDEAGARGRRSGRPGRRARGGSGYGPSFSSGGGEMSFSSCREAKAAGYRRIREGEAGYSRRLDRDGDGIACE